MKKILRILLLVFFLFVAYVYILSIDTIPNKMTLFEGENMNFKTIFGIQLKPKEEPAIETSSSSGYKQNYEVSLFDNIKLKNVDVNIIPKTKVIPVGSIAGVKLYTNGVLVVGMSEIEGKDNKKYKPYENTGISEGDTIIKIDDMQINSTDDLVNSVNKSNGQNIKINYIHNEESKECSITPIETSKKEYKIGLWVRDSAAGVGTVTFYEPETKTFGALGHGITDIDTGDIIQTSSGEIDEASIVSIVKGKDGDPGKIQGSIKQDSVIGSIYKNTPYGIYGMIKEPNNIKIDTSRKINVAPRQEISLGEATILSNITGDLKEYKIEIQKTYLNNNYDNKSMVIKVVDPQLLELTGGIIQGMSGSPIIQNNKFIGAVTHVFVKDSSIGYAVFADRMVSEICR